MSLQSLISAFFIIELNKRLPVCRPVLSQTDNNPTRADSAPIEEVADVMISRAEGHSAHFNDKLIPAEATRSAVVVVVRAVHVLGRRRLVYFDVSTAEVF